MNVIQAICSAFFLVSMGYLIHSIHMRDRLDDFLDSIRESNESMFSMLKMQQANYLSAKINDLTAQLDEIMVRNMALDEENRRLKKRLNEGDY